MGQDAIPISIRNSFSRDQRGLRLQVGDPGRSYNGESNFSVDRDTKLSQDATCLSNAVTSSNMCLGGRERENMGVKSYLHKTEVQKELVPYSYVPPSGDVEWATESLSAGC